MSDLISRKKICDYIKGEINPYGKPFEGTAYELGLKIIRYIDAMDSVYDADKVVEELEESSKWVNETNEYCDDGGNDYIPLSKAIEIVKHGGVGKDVEQMKATGIVRRFDDLGRIVIPKELRKQLFGTPEKSEGMPMEIFMDKDNIVLRKYEENKSDDVCEPSADKIKVTSLEVIVTGSKRKPYFEIKYKEVGADHYNIGYSSYNLDFVLDWKEKCFELVKVVE